MSTSNYYLKIPITNRRSFRIKEMSTQQFMVMQKYIVAEDTEDLNIFIDNFLNENQYNPEEVNTLNYIDKIIVILSIRMASVSYEIQVNSLSGGKSETIDKIIDQIVEMQNNTTFVKQYKNGFYIEYGLPKTLFFNDNVDILDECITSICGMDYQKLSSEERNELIGRIPLGIFRSLKDQIDESLKEIGENIVEFSVVDAKISMDYYKRELPMVCISLFKDDYVQFLELQYRYFSDMGGDYNHFINTTPMELQLLVKMHNKRIEDENKQQEESQRGMGSMKMPSMPSMPSMPRI